MAMSAGSSGDGPLSDINMTPLIDVMLVLLIIFIITIPSQTHAVKIDNPLPPPPNQPPPPPDQDPNVVIEIKFDKSIEINNNPVAYADLQNRLEDIFKTRAQKVVFVKGYKDLDYRYIAQAIDAAKGAGLDKVGLMTPKVEAGQ